MSTPAYGNHNGRRNLARIFHQRLSSPPTPECHTTLSHSSLGGSCRRRLAHLNSASRKERLPSLLVSSPRTSLEVFLKRAHSAYFQPGRRTRGLLDSKRVTLVKPCKAATEGRMLTPSIRAVSLMETPLQASLRLVWIRQPLVVDANSLLMSAHD